MERIMEGCKEKTVSEATWLAINQTELACTSIDMQLDLGSHFDNAK